MSRLSGPEQAIVNLIKLLRGAPGGSSVEIIPHDSSFYQLIASDTAIVSSTTVAETTNAAYTKVKEITALRAGTLRVSFELRTAWAGVSAYGKVYINSAAAGTERVNATGTYITYTEDFIIQTGDLVQIYAHSDGVRTAQIRTTELKATKTLEYGVVTLE